MTTTATIRSRHGGAALTGRLPTPEGPAGGTMTTAAGHARLAEPDAGRHRFGLHTGNRRRRDQG